ncbi:acyl-CoA synthetase [Chachezhania sediminis]|uniref:acyl-CoA synthetase n=1 Tax=Chachezhania sediminis TaxID=2599291 RepID=UPI00131E3EFB|nr:long-chain fatty acid--CoA ligase [Chachezhania sediminis]
MTIASILKKQVDRHPGKTALCFADQVLTYADLGARVDATAARLAGLGAGQGTKIAHLAFNDPSFFELLFACSQLGAVLVPVNFRLTPDEIAFQLANSESAIAVFTGDFAETMEKVRPLAGTVVHWIESLAEGLGTGAAPVRTPVADHAPDRALVMIHTSGTTGRPKGALLSERNILATVQNQVADFPLTRDDVTLTAAPVFHAGGSLICTLPLLLIGGTVILQKHFDPTAARHHMAEDGVTCMFAAPAMWQAIIATGEGGPGAFPMLRLALSGGAAETEQSMRTFRQMFGVTLMQGYGLSECSSTSTLLRAEDAGARLGSVGKPMMTNRVRVVRDDGTDCAPGEVGEIVQGDDTVMLGYYGNPEATAEAIRDGWLHTGDLGLTDEDGFLYIKGRKKEMIISGGENIYPAEVEQVLNAHPGIVESAVVGVPDPKWGETPVAFVVRGDAALTGAQVIAHCQSRIASYKKPTRVIFIDALPRNPSGKVKKFELVVDPAEV